jgi:hypothetical protein
MNARAVYRAAGVALALVMLPFPSPLAAEELYSDMGFFVDIPEGFPLSGGDGVSSFSFSDPYGYMDFLVIAYDPSRYPDPESAARDLAGKLGSKGKTRSFLYEGRKATLFELSFSLEKTPTKGLGVFIEGVGTDSGKDVALLSWAPAAAWNAYAPFIRSAIDSFAADDAARRAPGPLSAALAALDRGDEWAATAASGDEAPAILAIAAGTKDRTIAFADASIAVPYSAREAAWIEETCRREYSVLMAYGDEPDLAAAAMARFYRVVYRVSYRSLDRLSFEIGKVVGISAEPRLVAERVLAWVQNFRYERNLGGIDFANPYDAAFDANADCDSRAMLAVMVLHHLRIDAALLLSLVHSHAMLGVAVDGPGARVPSETVEYLVGETTSTIALGLVAADLSAIEDWFVVEFWF